MSDILIKGMEMPVTCSYCPLIAYDPDIEWNDGGRETQGAYVCVMTRELIDNTKREGHCPLVPIPPHGDLVDLKAPFKALYFDEMTEEWEEKMVTVGDVLYSCMVDEMPPITIPAEEGE